MLKNYLLSILIILSVCEAKNLKLIQDFENCTVGKYSNEMVKQQWQNIEWSDLYDRAEIVTDSDTLRNKVLRIHYPKGSVGPNEGGGQFVANIPPAKEYWLSYDVKFAENFDFRLGGKLPGLTSGGAQFTGGHKPEEGQGWSARFMWRQKGRAVVYFYSVGMTGKWGEDIPLNKTFESGKWYRITQHIVLNDGKEKNGLLEVRLDGEKVLAKKNMLYRYNNLGLINTLYFSTFFGGNTKEWGPLWDCVIYFDNFKLWHKN